VSADCRNSNITRRSAIAALTSAGVGLALKGFPVYANESTPDKLRKLLPGFSAESLARLSQLLGDSQYSGQIPAADVSVLVKNEKISVEKLMLELLPLARSYARPPISNFFVGVVVRGASGSLYTGANIEIPGQCLGFAVHAEQSALSNAYMHAEKAVTALAVNAAPCGHCRQFINEVAPDGEMSILTLDKPPAKLSAILPSAFGPADLGMNHGALPIQPAKLSLVKDSSDPLALAALDAASKSYSPYSKSPSGVAVRGGRGRIYRGSYIENVAFNPSLSPLQTALAAMIAAGEEPSAISGATLVESQEAKISQRPVTETVLRAIAPGARLEVIPAHS
jgi:cytidine deaminase